MWLLIPILNLHTIFFFFYTCSHGAVLYAFTGPDSHWWTPSLLFNTVLPNWKRKQKWQREKPGIGVTSRDVQTGLSTVIRLFRCFAVLAPFRSLIGTPCVYVGTVLNHMKMPPNRPFAQGVIWLVKTPFTTIPGSNSMWTFRWIRLGGPLDKLHGVIDSFRVFTWELD